MMNDRELYEEGLLIDLSKAQARIEELQAQRNFAQKQVVMAEAKLAKAMEHVADYSNDPHLWKWAYATLEELSSVSCANSKGEK